MVRTVETAAVTWWSPCCFEILLLQFMARFGHMRCLKDPPSSLLRTHPLYSSVVMFGRGT